MPIFSLSALSSEQRSIDFEWPLSKVEAAIDSVNGTEALGRMFEYEVLLLSGDSNLPFDELLGKHLTLKLEHSDLPFSRRHIDGHIAQVGLIGMVDTMFQYRIVIRPWLWLLTRTRDCRIFQEKTTEDIVCEVFADHGVADFEFQLTGSYVPREYCVQYRESDFDFVSRLLEEEGMYYFFKHDDGKHTLVICDSPTAHASVGPIRYRPHERQALAGESYIDQWTVSREVQPGVAVLKDYNFKKPSVDLTAKAIFEREHSESEHEVFDYPGEYGEPADGEQLVRARLEEIQAGQETVTGHGDSATLSCGALFDLVDFVRFDQNREFLITITHIEADNNLPELDRPSRFSCRFTCMPSDMQFRTPRTTPRPIVPGPQTAVVVGPAGEEIHVDEYGRVKVQFHWDRYGQHDDKSSCWIRVGSIWAGKNFGWITIPRIGQEVVVDFLEGNPDCPLITGRVYNAEQMPPWTLPDCKTQSGILTRSSKGGSPDNANRLQFEDKKGEELVTIHAERNMSRSVENDDSIHIGRDQMHVVKRNQVNVIEGHQKNQITKFQETEVKEYRKFTVKDYEEIVIDKAQKISVGLTQDITVGKAQVTNFGDTFTMSVKGDIKTKGDATRFDETAGDAFTKVGGGQTTVVTGDFNCKAMNTQIEATTKLVHKANQITVSGMTGVGIFANKIEMVSNAELALISLASIKQTSVGSDTTVLGSSSDGYVGMSAATRVGMHSETAISMDSETFIGLASSFSAALKQETCMGVHISTAIGAEMQLNTMTVFAPPSAGVADATPLKGPALGVAAVLTGIGAINTGYKTAAGLDGLGDQYDTAAKDLNMAAAKAAEAGLPALAARLSRLSKQAPLFGDSPVAPDDKVGSAADSPDVSRKEISEQSKKDQTQKNWEPPPPSKKDDGGGSKL